MEDSINSWMDGHDPVPTPIMPGEIIDGCEIGDSLGKGGNGEVFRAVDRESGQRMAIKVLLRSDETTKCRFDQEIGLLQGHDYPWLPKFYGSGEHKGYKYFKMEELSKIDLPHKDRDVAKFIVKVAKMVGELHRLGYVHRDIKPGNIMKRSSGDLVLIDFGLIKNPDESRSISVFNGVRQVVGTPGYAAPEQWSGGEIGPSTDIHTLGVLIKECFNEKIPAKWRMIYDRATCEDPALRFDSVEKFIEAIKKRNKLNDPFGGGDETVASRRTRKIKRLFTGVKVAAALVSIIAGVVSLYVSLKTDGKDHPKGDSARVNELELGNDTASGLYELACLYYNGDRLKRDLSKSAKCMKASADRGWVPAKTRYGDMLIHGEGTAKDEKEGVKYLEDAVANRDSEAMVQLADCLIKGVGCSRNEIRANNLIKDAAENHNSGAMYRMFEKYRDGSGFAKDVNEALRYLEKSANAGNALALQVLGDTYCQKFQDPGVCIKKEEDLKLATNYWYKSAIKGNHRAQYRLGVVLWGGYGPIEMDHEAAKKWLLQAASNGNDMAQYSLGRLMLKERPEEAYDWLDKQVKKGNPKAKKWMSVLLSSRKDKIQARRYAEEAADEFENLINTNEDCEAMYELAGQYSMGLGVDKDMKKAFELYLRAAKKGFAAAQFAVGYAYSNGEGVDQSDEKAVEWYVKSFNGGYAMGYTNLAYLYDHGKGVPEDHNKATEYYRQGAESGDACAQVALGWRLMVGLGVEKSDSKKGFEWIRRAASQNYASAYFGVSLCCYAGVGGGQDKNESNKWLEKAKKYGGGNETRKNIKVAIDAIEQLANKEDVMAMYLLGVSHELGFAKYASGNGISKDEKTARIWYRRSAEKGCAEAKRQLEK